VNSVRIRGSPFITRHITNRIHFLSLDSYRSKSRKIHKSSRTFMNPKSHSTLIQINFVPKTSNSPLNSTHRITQKRNSHRYNTNSSNSQRFWWILITELLYLQFNASTPPEVARCERNHRHQIGEEEGEDEVKDFTGSGSREERKEWNRITKGDPRPRIKRTVRISE